MKNLRLTVVALLVLLLSSCITIFEKYTIHANGTGTMEYIIDMSEMYEMMASFSDSAGDPGGATEIDQSMREALPGLNNIDGISNISFTGDVSKYIAGIKFDFRDANALNQAMAVLFEGEESITGEEKYIEIKGKTFTRYSLTSKEFSKDQLLGSEELDAETMKSVLESMKYKVSVSFDKKIKKVETLATQTLDEKSVLIETNFSELFDNGDFLKTSIKTK